MTVLELTAGTLAVWRVTHMLHFENGPWNWFGRLRTAVARLLRTDLFDCFYCLSLWTALPFAILLSRGVREGVVFWLALSGGAIVIERLLPVEAVWEEEP